jgi:hypothetical protein
MTAVSRREFGKIVMAGAPLAAALHTRVSAAGQVPLGVSTLSFREFPRVTGADNVDDVIRALKAIGTRQIELALANVEPAPPSVASFVGGTPAYPVRVVLTPEQIASTNKFYRADLRTWRGEAGLSFFEEAGAKFARAGLAIQACALSYDDSFTDAEIEATFKQITALGANTVSSPMTMATAARLVPFADRYRMSVAVHNQLDGNAAGTIAAANLKDALALSPRIKLKLDIGNLTASNADAVAVLGQHQARVSYVLLKDRRRNGGVSQHFGEGDTPMVGVLNVLKTSGGAIPAIVEYDYVGLRPAVEEVTASLAYVTNVLK